jgi:alanyl-tRNA synthetase
MTLQGTGPALSSAAIRRAFSEFFEARSHLAPPAASLVPAGDPSVLFTTAGMQQFKPYYLGVDTPPAPRLTTCQRCFRTSDIENVGQTARHETFFEMLGNFSIGDYFKREAIAWALEFSDQLGFDRARIKVSVFGGDDQVPVDDEAIAIWKTHGFSDDDIVRLGRGDNFWGPAGATGPCGPCSELYYDMGEEFGCGQPDCGPGCECDRWMEYWNLVFVQYEMDEHGGLSPLAAQGIDTGMGLERTSAIHQGVTTIFETDAFRPLIELGEQLSGQAYGSSEAVTRALRIMADHTRGIAFLVMDGVLPGNEGRDYVLRRIIRRAVQQGVSIGLDEPFLARLCERVVELMGGAYPALVASRDAIVEITGEEEARFTHTLAQGMAILDEALRRARDSGAELPPAVAFELHDTYGFPFDLTREIVQDRGMSVDEEGFERLMTEQRERARKAQHAGETGPGELETFQRDSADLPTTFVGYERLEAYSMVRAARVLADGRVALKLEESPFYAEGGGQVADAGWIHTDSGKLDVIDVVRFVNDQVIVGRLTEGSVVSGERAKAMVNAVRRHQTACNHTATHLLHNALRIVLGDEVRQAGSLVTPDRLRFDYKTRRAPTPAELRQIEDLANRRIVENHPVRPFVTTREYAAEIGALAFFEEKYGEFVRVLEIDEFSRELCGGTHVSSTSQIGLCKITASTSVGANTRRVEAITSAAAIEYYRGVEAREQELAGELGVTADRVPEAVRRRLAETDELREAARAAESGERHGRVDELLAAAHAVGHATLVAGQVDVQRPDELLALADEIRAKQPDAAVALLAAVEGRVAVLVAATDALVGRGLRANDILAAMMPAIEGRGGGKPTLARGGGTRVGGMAAALEAGVARARELLGD